MAGDRYEEVAPHRALAEVVACTWLGIGPSDDGAEPVMPDGCIDIVSLGDGDLVVAGPDTGPVFRSPQPGRTVGIRFVPGTAPRMLRVSASELVDQRVALADVWGRDGSLLTDRVA